MNDRTVRIACTAAATMELDDMTPIQGEFKSLSEEAYGKLRASIEKHGVTFPIFIWKENGINWFLDGHQRGRVLNKMREEGWTIPPLPVDFIEAADEREAKEKVVLLASQYGHITNESLYEYLETAGLDFDEVSRLADLPQIDLGQFRASYYEDPVPPQEFREVDENLETESVCPRCGYQFSGGQKRQKLD